MQCKPHGLQLGGDLCPLSSQDASARGRTAALSPGLPRQGHRERPGSASGAAGRGLLGAGPAPSAPIRERQRGRGTGTRPRRQTTLPPSNAERRSRLPLPQQPVTATIRLPGPPPEERNQWEAQPLQRLSQSASEPLKKRKSGARYLLPVTCGRAGRSGRVGRSSRAPGDAAGGGRSPRPLGPRWAAPAMTRPLGEGLPSPAPPFAMSRRHVTPAAAGREAAQSCRYRRGAAEGRSRSSPGSEPA